jgi:Ca2+-binding EF-hand superfamily protein
MSNRRPVSNKSEFRVKDYEGKGLSEDEILEIKEAFDLFDVDKSGFIDKSELKSALNNLGIDNRNHTLNAMMKDLDKDNSGQVSFNEFLDMMTAKMSDKDTREDLEKVFRLFIGDDNADKISFKHLKRVANDLQESMTDPELQEMINRADVDKDNFVSLDEFIQIMTKKI